MPECAVSGVAAGLHLVVRLPEDTDPAAVVRQAETRGVHVVDAASYRTGSAGPPALVLGYGNITDSLVPEAVSVLADVLTSQRRPTKA